MFNVGTSIYEFDNVIFESFDFKKEISYHWANVQADLADVLFESVLYVDDIQEISLESPEAASLLSEGLLGTLFHGIRNIIGKVFTFLSGLLKKMDEFIKMYTRQNKEWYAAYAEKVRAKAADARAFSYTGHPWKLDTNVDSHLNKIQVSVQSQSKAITEGFKTFNRLKSSNSKSPKDYEAVAASIKKGFPKGFKSAFEIDIESSLRMKISEITTKLYTDNKGAKMEIQGFSKVPIEKMLEMINNGPDIIAHIHEYLTTIKESVNICFDEIDKIKIDNLDTVANSESFAGVMNEAETPKDHGWEKDKPAETNKDAKTSKPKKEVEAEIQAAADNQPKDTTPPKGKTAEKINAATEDYTKAIRGILSDSVSTWNSAIGVASKICGAKNALVKDASAEFIQVLNKFINAKV